MQSYKIVPFHVAARETIVSPRNRMSIIMNGRSLVASRARFNRPIVALTVSAKLYNYSSNVRPLPNDRSIISRNCNTLVTIPSRVILSSSLRLHSSFAMRPIDSRVALFALLLIATADCACKFCVYVSRASSPLYLFIITTLIFAIYLRPTDQSIVVDFRMDARLARIAVERITRITLD